MRYHSTRGIAPPVPPWQALLEGAAADKGLYVPASLPEKEALPLGDGSYAGLAASLLMAFFPDLDREALCRAVTAAYARFDRPEVCPLVPVGDSFVLELFHGPTAAFKDIALCVLPPMMALARDQHSPEAAYAVLTATSGDTGSAAMAGFQNVPGFFVLVYYPDEGISFVQKAQMTRMPGDNLEAVGIAGNFDDAQAAVKAAFASRDSLTPPGLALTSANSINIGRLIPQVVYYIRACQKLQEQGALKPGQQADFVVPTGNFGDILAGYLARAMGWPIGRLVCASNKNRVLTDFLETGRYDRNRQLVTSLSPSMDILVSSNLERLLYYAHGGDAGRVRQLMANLEEKGRYQVSGQALAHIQEIFLGASATDEDCLSAIESVYREHCYLMDPHTAAAWHARQALGASTNPRVVLATASPFKFPETVLQALHQPVPEKDQDLLPRLKELTGSPLPPALQEVLISPVKHRDRIAREDILQDITRRLARW